MNSVLERQPGVRVLTALPEDTVNLLSQPGPSYLLPQGLLVRTVVGQLKFSSRG